MDRREFIGLATWLFLNLGAKAGPDWRTESPLKLVVGDRFSFRTTAAKTGGGTTTSFGTARGPGFLAPLPTEQSVRIVAEKECGRSHCLILEAERTLPPFLSKSKSVGYSEKITAHLDQATGEVYDLKTTLDIDGSISTSTERILAHNTMVADFYGAWMLDLRDNYQQTTNSNEKTVTLAVTGRENLFGRNCFIVKQTMMFDAGQKTESTIWVDAQRRFATKIARAGGQMQLIK